MTKSLSTKNILIVDDEPDLREMLEFEFEMAGANVTTAPNGREGFKILKEGNFDVVVSDIRMPGGDGIELIQSMNEHSIQTPLIFISGFADIQIDEAYALGASGYFAKPFVLQDIVLKVEKLCRNLDSRWIEDASPDETNPKYEAQLSSFSEAAAVVGRGGILLTHLEKMPRIDSRIGFELDLSGIGSKLKGVGTVRWVKKVKGDLGTCVGLDLISLDSESLEAYVKVLDELKPMAYIPKAEVV